MRNPEKLQKLKEVLELVDKDVVTKAEVVEVFQAVSNAIKTLRDENAKTAESFSNESKETVKESLKQMDSLVESVEKQLADHKKSNSINFENVTSQVNSISESLDAVARSIPQSVDLEPLRKSIQEIESKIPQLPDLTPLNKRIDEIEKKIPEIPHKRLDDIERIAKANAMPITTSFINGVRAKNIDFTGAAVSYQGDKAVVNIPDTNAVWGSITGTLSDQTDLQSAVDGRVPYSGATGAVDLNNQAFSAGNLTITGTYESIISAPTNVAGVINYGSGDYWNEGYSYEINVYAFKYLNGEKVFSPTSNSSGTITDNGGNDTSYSIDYTWDAVSGADGYRVIYTSNGYNSYSGDYYLDVTDPYFTDGNGSYSFSYGNNVSPNEVYSNANTINGSLTLSGPVLSPLTFNQGISIVGTTYSSGGLRLGGTEDGGLATGEISVYDNESGSYGDLNIDGSTLNLNPNTGGVVNNYGNLVNYGMVYLPNGSASSPALGFINSGQTGIYRGGTNILSFATAGTHRMSILANGDVGFGTTLPRAKLDIGGLISDSSSVFITPNVLISDNLNAASGVVMSNTNTGVSAECRFAIKDTQNSYLVFAVPSINNTASNLLGQTRKSAHFIFSNTNGAANARNFAIGTNSANDLIFGTNNAERIRVLSGGNVGIGVTLPSARLHTISTTEQLRVGYDTSNYWTNTVGSTGGVTFDAVGAGAKFTFSDDVEVPDEAYGAGWDASTEVPTKNAIYDKIETLSGGATQVFNEVPTGSINSSNTVFTTASPFATGTTRVFLNGIRQILGTDYTETDTDEITFTSAPFTGDTLIIDYQS